MKINFYWLSRNPVLKDAKTEDLIKELQIRLPNCKITIATQEKKHSIDSYILPKPSVTNHEVIYTSSNPYTFAGQAHPPFGFRTGNVTEKNTSKS
jgi:hypothetical protein